MRVHFRFNIRSWLIGIQFGPAFTLISLGPLNWLILSERASRQPVEPELPRVRRTHGWPGGHRKRGQTVPAVA